MVLWDVLLSKPAQLSKAQVQTRLLLLRFLIHEKNLIMFRVVTQVQKEGACSISPRVPTCKGP